MQYVKPFSEPFVNADKHLKGADFMSYDLGLDLLVDCECNISD